MDAQCMGLDGEPIASGTQDILVQMRRGEVLHELGDWLGGVWTLTWQTIVGGVFARTHRHRRQRSRREWSSFTTFDHFNRLHQLELSDTVRASLFSTTGLNALETGSFCYSHQDSIRLRLWTHNSVCGLLPSFAN